MVPTRKPALRNRLTPQKASPSQVNVSLTSLRPVVTQSHYLPDGVAARLGRSPPELGQGEDESPVTSGWTFPGQHHLGSCVEQPGR